MFHRSIGKLVIMAACVLLPCMIGCGPQSTMVYHPKAAGAKGETFGYRKWISDKTEPDVVLIGIHGFCGASIEYTNLGENARTRQRSDRRPARRHR